MELTPEVFRKVMGHFVTGVTVVTTFEEEQGPGADSSGNGTGQLQAPRSPKGITVNALSSVSLDPPLVMVALDRTRRITPTLRAFGRFAVNVLGEGQQGLSDCFAGANVTPDREAFCGASWAPGLTGLPLLDGAIATLECTTIDVVSAGDHDVFIARVDTLANEERHAMPLLYYRRRYLRIERAATAQVEGRNG
jgi:3-hydroxy-9,10-secoandrosta-1,3,5(10)-triene-9,17-dione monooxygenase reductase component